MIVYDIDQRTPEWFALRAGKLTGSVAKDMLAQIKTGEAAARRDLRMRIVCERLTGQPQDNGYVNAEMQRGIDMEHAALAAYESLMGNLARAVGFLQHDTLAAGHSPDGLIGEDGLLELKVPKSATHLGYLRAGTLPSEHRAQILHGLWISGRDWCDFLSYDDRLGYGLDTFLVRVKRADVLFEIAEYANKAEAFLRECDEELDGIVAMRAHRLAGRDRVYAPEMV